MLASAKVRTATGRCARSGAMELKFTMLGNGAGGSAVGAGMAARGGGAIALPAMGGGTPMAVGTGTAVTAGGCIVEEATAADAAADAAAVADTGVPAPLALLATPRDRIKLNVCCSRNFRVSTLAYSSCHPIQGRGGKQGQAAWYNGRG